MFSGNQPFLIIVIVLAAILFMILLRSILNEKHEMHTVKPNVWKRLRFAFNPLLLLKDKWAVFIGIPTVSVLFAIQLIDTFNIIIVTASFLFTALLWHGDRSIIIIFRNHFPGYHQTIQRIIYEILFITPFTLILVSLSALVTNYIYAVATFELITAGCFSLIISFLLIFIYESRYFLEQWQKNVVIADNLQSQFESLKNQVNPHFLFNSLNSLSTLIEEDTAKAEQFIHDMSQVYRYLLHPNSKPLTSISAELSFMKAYSFLLKTRFNDGLDIEVKIPSSYHSWMIPPLTLQMLVENAIKHNIVSKAKPLRIKLFVEGNELVVSNNLQRRSGSTSVKSGLGKISDKCRLLNQRRITINETIDIFEVRVLLMPEDNSIFSLNENNQLNTI